MPGPGKPFQAFAADLDRFAELVEIDLGTVRRKVALDLFAKVTMRSPVDTGRFRSSWALSDTVPSEFAQPPDQENYPAQGEIFASFSGPYGLNWLVNNLAYAQALEFGHSGQAPSGVARISVAEIEAELEATLERLR